MIIDDGFKLMERYLILLMAKLIAIDNFRYSPQSPFINFISFFSVAILRYLCATRNLDDHWYPKDPKLQARVDEYLEWQHIDIRSNTMGYLMNKVPHMQ